MIDLLLAINSFVVTAAVIWRLANLPLPDASWRCRGVHGAWVAAHVLIGAGALNIGSSLPSETLSKPGVLFLLAGVAILFLGRWRRRVGDQGSSQPRASV